MARRLATEDLVWGYGNGWFPMAEPDGEIYWYKPRRRGVFELDGLRISRSLRQTLHKNVFSPRFDTAFREVMERCAARRETWISDEIIHAYCELHALGYAHSVEAWQNGALAGGLYGVSLGGAFFGESMFSRAPDASKVALVWLAERLRARGYALLDTQFITPHLARLGAIEISDAEYQRRLRNAIKLQCTFID